MDLIAKAEDIDHHRRRFLNAATMAIAATAATRLLPSRSVAGPADDAIHPFRADIAGEQLADLRRRITATRWSDPETVSDRSQGTQLAKLQELMRYWGSEHDWRKAEARLNALPQFRTTIDGVVLPSLPGYGFSGAPTQLGWESGRIAHAWATLMNRLGYTRYVAQGGDVGADVTDAMGRQAPDGLVGIHLNLLTGALGLKDKLPAQSEQERAALGAVNTFTMDGFGYFLEQSTRPQTIGYSLLDSPIALAAWLLDHDTDSYYKISRAFVDGEPVGNLTRDNILDNITLYWLTGTGASAARWYWEFGRFLAAAHASGKAPPPVAVPVAFTTFPDELWAAPRSWVEAVYPGLAYFNAVDRGGHFAAWEEPRLFSAELRAAFRPLRPAR